MISHPLHRVSRILSFIRFESVEHDDSLHAEGGNVSHYFILFRKQINRYPSTKYFIVN